MPVVLQASVPSVTGQERGPIGSSGPLRICDVTQDSARDVTKGKSARSVECRWLASALLAPPDMKLTGAELQHFIQDLARSQGRTIVDVDTREVIDAAQQQGYTVEPWDVLTAQNKLFDAASRASSRGRVAQETLDCGGALRPVRSSGGVLGGSTAFSVMLGSMSGQAPAPIAKLGLPGSDPTQGLAELRNELAKIEELGTSKKHEVDQAKLSELTEGDEGGAFERAVFDLSAARPPVRLFNRPIERLEVRMGSLTKGLGVFAKTKDGTTIERYLPWDQSGPHMNALKQRFDRFLAAGGKLPGASFEHDKSRAFHEEEVHTHKDEDWDVEMTTSGTAEAYERSVYPAILDALQHLERRDAMPRNAVIFDVACGRGDLTSSMHDAFPEAKVVGGEFNQKSLEAATERFAYHGEKNQPQVFRLDAVNQLKSSAEALGIRPNVVVMSGFIAKVVLKKAEGVQVMRQVYDLLPPGGLVVMAQKTDNLLSAGDFERLGFEVANTFSPAHNRSCIILRKPE